MNDLLTYVGLATVAGLVGHLVLAGRRAGAPGAWHPIAAAGLAVLGLGHLALAYRIEPIYLHLTPWMWTGFILLADAVNFRLAGRSLILSRGRVFAWLLPISVVFWVLFEAYNLRLENWVYIGVPENAIHRNLAYAWAFATILPALFEASELYYHLVFRAAGRRAGRPIGPGLLRASVFVGVLFLVVPPLFEPSIAGYLFGFVWIGVILVFDPLNYWAGRRSLWRDIEQGDWRRMASLWWGGVLCGFLWEFWNYWASAKWIYVFPILQDWKIFEMPVPGYLGFPFFALECFVFCEWLAWPRNAPPSRAFLDKTGLASMPQ